MMAPVIAESGERLADAVYRVLHSKLSTGQLSTGTRLVEADLAEQLGVSRTPLREALRRLEAEGTVESSPHRGFVVVDLLADAEIVYAIRQRLEGLAAAEAARRITLAELENLQELHEEMEARGGDDRPEALQELVNLNKQFHESINEAAASRRLNNLVRSLAPAYISRQVISFYTPEERKHSWRQHREILDALWKRDTSRADSAVQEHLASGMNVVLRGLATNLPGAQLDG